MALADDIIAQLRERPLPDVVYHYTTPTGLLGIVTSQRIWATDVRYLNDSSEFHYTHALCVPTLGVTLEKYADTDPERMLLGEILHYLDAAPIFRTYAASFSAAGNLLSQWRAYCPPSGGFSVGITAKVLEQRSGHKLIPCIYEPAEQETLIKGLVDRTIAAYLRGTPVGEEEPERLIRIAGLAIEFLGAFLVLAAAFKSKSFAEEVEWRLITRAANLANTPPSFREGRGGVVPFLEIPLVLGEQALRLDQVVVGPNPHEQIAKEAVQALLERHKVQHDGVELAGIPYRSW